MAMLAAAWLTVAPRHLWVDKFSRGFTVQERPLLEISDSTRSPVEALWNPNLPTHPVCQLCHADPPDEHKTLKRAKFPEEVSRGGHRYLKRRRRKAGKTPISEKGQSRGGSRDSFIAKESSVLLCSKLSGSGQSAHIAVFRSSSC